MIAGDERVRVFRLEGKRGALIAVYFPPRGRLHPLGDVLVAPAFGEEMNRCRSMVSMQARELAGMGIGVLVLDPLGTGDSAGEFSDATWAFWKEDLQAGIQWLRHHGNGCRALWGVRLGAIMAAELAVEDPRIEQLLFWQPVVDGKQFFTQFLRIRIAAELEQSGRVASTGELRELAAAGGTVEVSGYRLSGKLAQEIDTLRLPDVKELGRTAVIWCEVLPAADSTVQRANAKVVEAWQQAGVGVQLMRVVGPSFWHVHERAVAPELLVGTTRLMAECARGSSTSMGNAAVSALNGTLDSESVSEYPIVFGCDGDDLIGVLHRSAAEKRRGIVIVVAGGPQYRAGAHRQFVALARVLANRGYPTLRFDLRGMGDSSGEHRGFQQSEADIRSAIDALLAHEPRLESVVLLGECESASGILFYAFRDERVQGAILVNPWVRTDGGRATVILKHYYLQRLASREFWRKVAARQFNLIVALRSFVATIENYVAGRKLRSYTIGEDSDIANLPLPVKTATGLRRFHGPVMILMSGSDYIAREFDEITRTSKAWAGLLNESRVTRKDIAGADHTFSREVWKRQAQDWICDWLETW